MNFLDNYAPVVGEFTCISACFDVYYHSFKNILPFLVGLNPPALKFSSSSAGAANNLVDASNMLLIRCKAVL